MKSHELDSLGDDFLKKQVQMKKSETISASSIPHGNPNIILDDGIDPSTSGHKEDDLFSDLPPSDKADSDYFVEDEDDLEDTTQSRQGFQQKDGRSRHVKKAFRKLARDNHPDKGGDPELFKSQRHMTYCLIPKERTIYA